MPRVSVIIPTFNREKFVTKAIDSVLSQGFNDYEIIVVDDGSTDNTLKALEPYRKQIHYIYQENSGVSAARNAGIMQARGEWISFLDSDDEWMEDYLSTQMAQVLEFPCAVVHITNAVTVYADGKKSEHFDEIDLIDKFGDRACLLMEKPFEFVIDGAYLFLQATILRRGVLLQAGLFDTALSIAEDVDVMARMALKGPFAICKKVLVRICRREESVENLASQRLHKGIYSYQAFEKVYSQFLNHSELSFSEKMMLAHALGCTWRGMGNLLLRTGKRPEARQFYKRSFFVYPSVRAAIKCAATFLPQKISQLAVRKGKDILPGKDINIE